MATSILSRPLTIENMKGKSIDDLVGLYDKIGNTLPNMSDQEINYLLLDSAQAHKESLLRTNSALTSAPTSSIIDSHFESQLEKVKAELHSIRYERMVVDVFTRQTVDQTQRNAFGSLDPTLRQEKISTSRRNNVLALDPKKRVYQPTASFASKTTASKTAPSSSNSINNAAAALASRKRLQRLQEYIDIPTYQPGTNFTSNQPIENIRASTLFPLRVRSIGRDSLVVPSLRQGSSLPVELSTLRLKTTIAPPYSSDLLRRSSGDDADTTSLPLARNLYRQIKRNEAQIHSVRESLQQHTAKTEKDQVRTYGRFRHLEHALGRQQREMQASTTTLLADAMERIESLVSSQIGPSSEPARSSLRVVSSAQPAISSSIKKATSDAWTYTDELPRVPTQQPTQNQYIDEILATYKVLPVRSRSTSPRPSSTEIISQQGVTTRVSSLAKAVDIGTEAPQRPFVTVSGPRVHLDPLPTALSSTEAQTVPVNDNTDKMLTFMQELLARQQEALASSAELAQAMVTHAISREESEEARLARELEMRREQWEMQVAGVASAVDLGRALVSAIENIASTHSMGKDRDTIVHVEAPAVVDGPTIGQAVKEGIVEGLRRPAAPNLEPTPQPSASPSSLPESSFRIDGGFLRTSHIQPRVDADVARVDHKFVQDILIESNPYLRHEVVTDSIELVTFSQTSMVSEDEALQMRDTPLLISNQQSQATYSSLSSFQGARVGARALTSRSLRAQNGRFTPIVSALVEHAATLAVVGMTNQSLFGSPASSYSGSSPVPESSLLTIGEQVICGENSSLALPSESLSEEAKTDLHPNVSIPELFTRPNNNEPINSPAVLGSQLEEGDSVMEEGLHSPAPSTNSRPHRYSPDSQAESGSGSDAEADYSIVTEA